jgi:hypothetical protein
MYTKTKKTEKSGNKKHPEKETVLQWMKLNALSKKDVDSMMEISPEEFTKELLQFEKILKEKNSGK